MSRSSDVRPALHLPIWMLRRTAQAWRGSADSPNVALPTEATLRAGGPRDAPGAEPLLDLATDLLATADSSGYFTRVNGAWERHLGWTSAELLSRPCLDFVHPADVDRTRAIGARLGTRVKHFENRYLCKDGGWRALSWTAYKHGDTWYAAARDVTERAELERQALHDPLTGLPNRVLFSDRLKLALARLRR